MNKLVDEDMSPMKTVQVSFAHGRGFYNSFLDELAEDLIDLERGSLDESGNASSREAFRMPH